jgi:2-C-methyl-D-erythritol 4-phosphate cytidylyltransferase
MSLSSGCWVVVPAAGSGSRMQAALPKQYLHLNGETVLTRTLQKLLMLKPLSGIVVSVSADDTQFVQLPLATHPLISSVIGGRERAHSVLNGLVHLLAVGAHKDDWVLVHDAARPCVTLASIHRLVNYCQGLSDTQMMAGAILAAPVADTLKMANANLAITHTVPRESLWQAHTPQCFRLGHLHDALAQTLAAHVAITDEASAVEYCGGHVQLIADTRDNIKITSPEDLALAEFILSKG